MPPGRKANKRKGAAAVRGEDCIGSLPDDLLHHVLSSLPVREVVRTCVLSRRWAHLWKSMHILRFTQPERWWSVAKFNNFVNRALSLRNRGPLQEFMFETFLYDPFFSYYKDGDNTEPLRYAKRWIMYALMCNVQVLRVLVNSRLRRPLLRPEPLLRLNEPLISQHLKILELKSLILANSMDFSRCPALEDLELWDCQIWLNKISFQSLSRLVVNNCEFSTDICTQILAPNLISLVLDVRYGRVPYLQSAVLLVTAYIILDQHCTDHCWHSKYIRCGHDTCVDCYDNKDGSGRCVLLRGLSNASNLELASKFSVDIQHRGVAIFKQDMKLCPIFSNLKTLVLDGLVVAREFDTLFCFLQCTPILEKITFQLNELKYEVQIGKSCSSLENFVLPERLK